MVKRKINFYVDHISQN